ncbi:hypothetical protein J7E93_07515 [Streptomyces sp. ISL-36]|uniref:hypothetical protein n=1 Tax=Streptomyces sp. ISL-36 TaxID=2819182 RepID=UPI001BE51C8E|nr:hypothetical protein [Streptomyces sp. ISL-36]MBT2439970.1 hypothetical protein [Streptomyces sp. ISL-36]
MTSSLDWAGLATVIAAAVQSAAAVVQVYWDRQQRGAWMMQNPVFGEPVPARVEHPTHGSLSVHVQIGVLQPSRPPVSVTVRVGEAGGMDAQSLPSAKEHGPW